MANYFARVELHGAEWPDDYENLHENLAGIGFTTCVKFKNGGSNKLPTGFYYAQGQSSDKNAVAKKVFSAADATGYTNEVVVVKSSGSNSRLNEDCD